MGRKIGPPPPERTKAGRSGRVTRCTPELPLRLVDALKAGYTRRNACALVGISHQTLYNWLDRGAEGEQPFADFRMSILSGEAKAASEAVDEIRKAGRDGDWRASAWFLARRFPEAWSERHQVTHEGGETPIKTEVKDTTEPPTEETVALAHLKTLQSLTDAGLLLAAAPSKDG